MPDFCDITNACTQKAWAHALLASMTAKKMTAQMIASQPLQVMYGRQTVVKVDGERAHPHISQDSSVLFPKQHVGHYDPASTTLDFGPILVRPAGYASALSLLL